MKRLLYFGALVMGLTLGASGCSDDRLSSDEAGSPSYFQGPIVIWNLSLFPQLELYAHPYLNEYKDYPESTGNLLIDGPLEDQAVAVIQFSQNFHITAIREQVSGGPKMILTTAIGLPIYDPYHVLMIFRDGFRLLNRYEAEAISSFPGWPEEITSWQAQDPWNEPSWD